MSEYGTHVVQNINGTQCCLVCFHFCFIKHFVSWEQCKKKEPIYDFVRKCFA